MKITQILFLSVSGGLLFITALPAPAQDALRTNAAGNLTPGSTLNLGGPGFTGTLPPLHVGTGTPSSATVLRGDGAWVGTTPSGNTVAATANLLMGDGVGNAAAVSSSSELQHVLQMRAETARKLASSQANLLGSANLVLRNGTLNADGTLTIPAHDYVQWNNAGDSAAHLPRYCYAVSTTDQPAGKPDGFYICAFYNGYNNVGFGSNEVFSQPAPGVSKYVFTNNVGDGSYTIFVTNAASVPVTIYPPVMTLLDRSLLAVSSFAENIAVSSQPVANLDFTTFANGDKSGRYLAEQQTTVAIANPGGADSNPGTLYSPKLTLGQPAPNGSVFGLYRASVFRDSLPFASLGTTHGITVQDLAFGSVKPLPVISALDPVLNNGVVNNGDGTYSYTWNGTGLLNDGYQNVYVVEINTATEGNLPVASRRRMTDVTSAAAVVATPGSVYVQPFGPGQWLAQFRPSDGQTPGSGGYRYEVVARYSPADWGGPLGNPGDGAMSGVELVGSSWGYGELGAPLSFSGDRLVFLHCTTHHAVIGSGSLQRSVFYEMGDAQAIQLAWYTGNPAGLRWSMSDCLFYANVGDRIANCLISHSSGTSYDRGDIADCAFLGARWSNGSLQGNAIEYDNVTTGTIQRVYVQGMQDIFGYNMPVTTEVKNCVFRQVNKPRIGVNFHDNIVLAESGSDPVNGSDRSPYACYLQQNGASATNNILWARGISTGITNDDSASGIQHDAAVTSATVQKNIIVINPANPAAQGVYANLPAGNPTGLSFDYNLVINLAKGGFVTVGGTGNTYSWAAYQVAYPTLDPHSLYLDLSADPRGLKAVFMDPINGDFRWAQTDVARQCAAFCSANNAGPATVSSRWPVVPSVDEAVLDVTNN